eukprot:2841356-Amphidinium_carterae.3
MKRVRTEPNTEQRTERSSRSSSTKRTGDTLDDSERVEQDATTAVDNSLETASAARVVDTDAVVMTVDEETKPKMLTGADLWIPQADNRVENYYEEIKEMPLPRDAVLKARSEELADYAAMNVYKDISHEEAMTLTGRQQSSPGAHPGQITTDRPRVQEARCRQPFTATPPWMAFRAVFSSLMTKRGKSKHANRVMLPLDMKRAFFLCVTPPHLEGTGQKWLFLNAMYGHSVRAVTTKQPSVKHLAQWDWKPHSAHHAVGMRQPLTPMTEPKLCFRGDDIAIEGEEAPMDTGQDPPSDVKRKLGFGQEHDGTGMLLSRCITLTSDKTLVVDADLSHVDLLVAGSGLNGNSKTVKSPTQKLTAGDYVATSKPNCYLTTQHNSEQLQSTCCEGTILSRRLR